VFTVWYLILTLCAILCIRILFVALERQNEYNKAELEAVIGFLWGRRFAGASGYRWPFEGSSSRNQPRVRIPPTPFQRHAR